MTIGSVRKCASTLSGAQCLDRYDTSIYAGRGEKRHVYNSRERIKIVGSLPVKTRPAINRVLPVVASACSVAKTICIGVCRMVDSDDQDT